jgi:hypothetical protein
LFCESEEILRPDGLFLETGLLKIITALACLLSIGGCATIMHGDSQEVEISSIPAGAVAYIEGNSFITPARVRLKRGYPLQEQQILFQKEGFKPAYAKIEQKLSGWLWGDIIWGILPGLAVDAITGAAFDLHPTQITAILETSAK